MSNPEIPTIPDPEDNESEGVKNLRGALARSQDEAMANALAARELPFVKAGIDIETGTGKLLFTAYEGELTVDAVKAAAIEFGIIKADDGTPPPPDEAEIERRRQEDADRRLPSGDGVTPPGDPGDETDLLTSSLSLYEELVGKGMSKERARAQVISQMMVGEAMDGNAAAQWDEAEWKANAVQEGEVVQS